MQSIYHLTQNLHWNDLMYKAFMKTCLYHSASQERCVDLILLVHVCGCLTVWFVSVYCWSCFWLARAYDQVVCRAVFLKRVASFSSSLLPPEVTGSTVPCWGCCRLSWRRTSLHLRSPLKGALVQDFERRSYKSTSKPVLTARDWILLLISLWPWLENYYFWLEIKVVFFSFSTKQFVKLISVKAELINVRAGVKLLVTFNFVSKGTCFLKSALGCRVGFLVHFVPLLPHQILLKFCFKWM